MKKSFVPFRISPDVIQIPFFAFDTFWPGLEIKRKHQRQPTVAAAAAPIFIYVSIWRNTQKQNSLLLTLSHTHSLRHPSWQKYLPLNTQYCFNTPDRLFSLFLTIYRRVSIVSKSTPRIQIFFGSYIRGSGMRWVRWREEGKEFEKENASSLNFEFWKKNLEDLIPGIRRSVGWLVLRKAIFGKTSKDLFPFVASKGFKKRFPHPRQGVLFHRPPAIGRPRKKSFPFLNWMKIQLNFFRFLLRIFRERAIPLAHDVPSLFSFFFLTGK